MGERGRPQVHLSVSTWQQPLPRPASPERSVLVESVAKRILTLDPGRLRVGINGRTAAGNTPAPPDAVLIVDGVFAFRPEINWDLRIWLEVDSETSVRRGAERDQDWAGAEAEAVHRDRYLPAEQLYIGEADPLRLADIVIDNSAVNAPDIVRR